MVTTKVFEMTTQMSTTAGMCKHDHRLMEGGSVRSGNHTKLEGKVGPVTGRAHWL